MKRIILFLVGLLTCYFVYSAPIDISVAKKVALNYILSKKVNHSFSVENVLIEMNENLVAYYIVTFNEGGWVMIAADDNSSPILGYSLDGIIDENTPKPLAFMEWNTNLKFQIKWNLKISFK